MKYKTRLPNSLPSNFRDRVRRECDFAGTNRVPTSYPKIAEATIGDADRGSQDCRFIRLVTKALMENMRDDIKAGRPLSAVAVHSAGSNMPGGYFFNLAFELGRFTSNHDPVEFVADEWSKYCQSFATDDDIDGQLVAA